MALIVEAVGQTGVVERITVQGGAAVINAQPGLTYRILDEAGTPLNAGATVRRVGDHLIIEGLPEETTVQLTDFFFVCTPNDPCSLDLEGLGGARGETINQLSEPVAALADGSFVLHAPESMATPVAPESEFSGKPALAGLALLGLAGGGGSGGGGGGGGPPPPPPGSTTVTSPPFTNDTTPVIAGKAVPGAQITVTLDIPGSGPVTFSTIADGNGDWSVDTGAAAPIAGVMPAAGLALDAPTTVRVLTSGSTEPITYQLSMDLVPPDAPVIQAVTGDDLINADEAREANPSPITVQGTAEPGATVRVTWHGDDQVATADAEGNWVVTFNGQEIPDGDYIISAVAIDVAGNTGAASNRPVTVHTGRPSAPSIDDVAGDHVINAAESAGDLVITGTTAAGTEVLVSFGGVVTDRQATVTGTDWSVTVTAAELAQLQDGQTYQVTAYASDGVNRSVVGASDPVLIDRTPPAAPSITNQGEAADGIINAADAVDGVTIGGSAEAGGKVQVSWGGVTLPLIDVDANGNWTAVFASGEVPSDGSHTISVAAFDAAGNASPTPAQLPVQVDTTVATPTLALASDTGSSGGDGITANGAMNVGGLESGGNWQYSVDGGANWNPGSGTGFTLPPGAYAPNAVQVRQTDAAGNVSDARGNPAGITVDNAAPPAPSISLTPPNTINVGGLEAGALWQYSLDGGGTWANGTGTSFSLPDGSYAPNTIQARQTDVAGNQGSPGGNAGPIAVDIIPPDPPTLALTEDTGIDGDGVTTNGTMTVGGLETGATWEYSTDGGGTWAAGTGTSFVLAPGDYPANAVRVHQIDSSSNPSTATGNADLIRVDTTPPAAPSIALAEDAGSDGSDGITNNGTVNVGGLEPGATWQYSTDAGANWAAGTGTSFTLPAGIYGISVVQVSQFDLAGNPGAASGNMGQITVDATPPAVPDVSIFQDTGTVALVEADATWEYTVNGGTDWIGGTGADFTLAPGLYGIGSVAVRQTDVAGNTSDSWSNLGPILVIGGGEFVDGGASTTLMSLDTSIPAFEFIEKRSVSIDALFDDSNGAPGMLVGNGGTAGDATPTLSLSLSDLLGDDESIQLLRDGALVASTSDQGSSWTLDDAAGLTTGGPHIYTAELVSGGSVLATSDPHLYNFHVA